MKVTDFLNDLMEELEIEVSINISTKFEDLEEWDSMGAMVLIGYVADNFGITLTGNDIEKLTDIQSLVTLIGEENFE
ncbi:acyl carrier protein [Schleiferiaceae bacterium]|nr:acyl carrier protein [Schleiferiaceae bacterium]